MSEDCRHLINTAYCKAGRQCKDCPEVTERRPDVLIVLRNQKPSNFHVALATEIFTDIGCRVTVLECDHPVAVFGDAKAVEDGIELF